MAAQFTYLRELTVPADSSIAVGTPFIKTWRVQNTGDVAWDEEFTIRFEKGTAMTANTVQPLPTCQPGEIVDISVNMTAPHMVGTFWGDWYLADPNGEQFGVLVWVRIHTKLPVALGSGDPNVEFIEDVTIPDGTIMDTGKRFDKVWRVRNTGNVPWDDGFQLVHVDGSLMANHTIQDVPNASIGEVVDVALHLTAPNTPGNHITGWRFRSSLMEFFGDRVYAEIMTRQAVNSFVPLNAFTYVRDVTIPDDSEIDAGQSFTKTWRIRNSGNTVWGDGYTLRYMQGEPMTDELMVNLPVCEPGDEIDVSLHLTTPNKAGKLFGDWRLYDATGNPFGEILWFRIVVPESSVVGDSSGNGNTGTGSSGSVTFRPRSGSGSGAVGSITHPGGGQQDNANIEIMVKHYSQRDPRWQGLRLGKPGSTQTIGSWGCLMTAMTMFANWKGHNETPSQFMNLMLQRGGFFGTTATSWNALQKVYGDIFLEGFEPVRSGNKVSLINAKLDQKIPVLVQVDRTPNTSYTDADTHWVLVIGREGNSDYWIADPIELGSEPTLLTRRYGRAGQPLHAAIVSVLPYR